MLALRQCEQLTCPGCAGWTPETTAIENDERYQTEAMRCHSCTAQALAQELHGRDTKYPGAVRWTVPTLKPRR